MKKLNVQRDLDSRARMAEVTILMNTIARTSCKEPSVELIYGR